MISNVSNFQGHVVRKGSLDAQGPSGYVGTAQVAVGGEDVTRRRVSASARAAARRLSELRIEGYTGRAAIGAATIEGPVFCNRRDTIGGNDFDCAGARSKCTIPVAIKVDSSRDLAKPEEVALSIEGVQTELLINEAAPGADNGFSVSSNVPGKPEAGSEIVVIAVERRINPMAHLLEPHIGIKIADQAVSLLHNSRQLIAQPQIHSKPGCNPPVVLKEYPVSFEAVVPQNASYEKARIRIRMSLADEEVIQ